MSYIKSCSTILLMISTVFQIHCANAVSTIRPVFSSEYLSRQVSRLTDSDRPAIIDYPAEGLDYTLRNGRQPTKRGCEERYQYTEREGGMDVGGALGRVSNRYHDSARGRNSTDNPEDMNADSTPDSNPNSVGSSDNRVIEPSFFFRRAIYSSESELEDLLYELCLEVAELDNPDPAVWAQYEVVQRIRIWRSLSARPSPSY